MTHPGIAIVRELLGDSRLQPTTIEERRAGLEAMTGAQPAPDGVTVEVIELAGRPAERLTPAAVAIDDAVLLYLHGGGYVSGSPQTHRSYAGNLALGTGVPVVTLDYRLGPEDPFPAGLNDALLAFDQLAPARVAIAGDSAGGGLSLATAVALRDRGGAMPAALLLVSPWTDLTQSSPAYEAKADEDPMLSADSLTEMADAYLAGTDPRTELASPVFADLTGLPPTRIDVGSAEVLLDDSTTVADRLREAGVPVELQVWDEMIHVFPAFPPEILPEAAEALALETAFLTQHLAS
jgi:monoterpene epsilon-lactone hydrolase